MKEKLASRRKFGIHLQLHVLATEPTIWLSDVISRESIRRASDTVLLTVPHVVFELPHVWITTRSIWTNIERCPLMMSFSIRIRLQLTNFVRAIFSRDLRKEIQLQKIMFWRKLATNTQLTNYERNVKPQYIQLQQPTNATVRCSLPKYCHDPERQSPFPLMVKRRIICLAVTKFHRVFTSMKMIHVCYLK